MKAPSALRFNSTPAGASRPEFGALHSAGRAPLHLLHAPRPRAVQVTQPPKCCGERTRRPSSTASHGVSTGAPHTSSIERFSTGVEKARRAARVRCSIVSVLRFFPSRYLNSPEEGGGTKFNDLSVTVNPKRGSAVRIPARPHQPPLLPGINLLALWHVLTLHTLIS